MSNFLRKNQNHVQASSNVTASEREVSDCSSSSINSSNSIGVSLSEDHHQTHSPPPSYSSTCPQSAFVESIENTAYSDSGESNCTTYRTFSGLESVYSPDILHVCSLVLPNHEKEAYHSEYIEIDELCTNFKKNINQTAENNVTAEGCFVEEYQKEDMGQFLSLRRPRISLTWVLREQQQSGEKPFNTENNDKRKFKPKIKPEKLFNEKYVNTHNFQDFEDKQEPYKELKFVNCGSSKELSSTIDKIPKRHRSESCNHFEKYLSDIKSLKSERINSHNNQHHLKGTYSEPSLSMATDSSQKRHRHRKRRDRNKLQKFGYDIRNVDEFLSKCSLASPANIPVVLSSSNILYQTRPGGYQIEIPLPLGMVVNAVFKNENWLYVQTPHAEEGYVAYSSCLPLGILPSSSRNSSTTKPAPCWDTNRDIFPKPCGNMTDSEKEIHFKEGTRSDGVRTPNIRRAFTGKYIEDQVDQLYLRAASKPKLTEKTYAQLRSTNTYNEINSTSKHKSGDQYVIFNQKAKTELKMDPVSHTKSIRQTLVAITFDYATESISVKKGDIVTLLHCLNLKDKKQWFYIKTRQGNEGFIPAEVAGHGFL